MTAWFFIIGVAHDAVAKPSDTLVSVQKYAQHLMAGEAALELGPSTEDIVEGGALVGCRKAVEIITRNPRKGR